LLLVSSYSYVIFSESGVLARLFVMSGPQNLLARGMSNPSPSEDLHRTIKSLLDENTHLKEKIEEVEGDKRHFQRKLEEYIRSDREENGVYPNCPGSASSTGDRSSLLREIDMLRRENAKLSSQLSNRSSTSLPRLKSSHEGGGSNPVLLHQLGQLSAARSICVEQHERKMESMKLENFRLKEEVERLKRNVQFAESTHIQDKRLSWGDMKKHMYIGGETGYSSLPETLPSFSSTASSSSHVSTLSTSTTSNITGAEDPLTAEVRRLKKQLEKYKTVNIDLDQKLKDANLDLRRQTEGRGSWNASQQMNIERLEGEVSRLRSQLDQAMGENNQLRSIASRRAY